MEDLGTGLVLLGARYYDPVIGRFLSVDPQLDPGNPAQFNAYVYAGNNPVTYSDPSGLSWLSKRALTPVRGHGVKAPTQIAQAVSRNRATAAASAARQRISEAVQGLKQRLSGAGGCSFVGSTGVLMADGTVKAIDQVKPGDEVLATDPETGRTVARRVDATHVHDDVVLTLVLITSSGQRRQIRTTEDHPFWSQTEGQFQRADQLEPGELVLTADGGTMKVHAVLTEEVTFEPAWNLTVQGLHTYSVIATGTDVGAGTTRGPPSPATAVLVHNCPITPGVPGPAANTADNVPLTCFVAGTLVRTEAGLTPIEEIEVGDKVWAKDLVTGKDVLRVVDRTFVRHTEQLVHLTIDGQVLTTTAEHPFWVDGRGWVEAGDLKPGDVLVTPDGVATLDRKLVEQRSETVYNLRVTIDHNYYALAGDTPVLVHNADYNTAADLADALDDNVVFHYTDDAGLEGILGSGTIRADGKGRAYVSQAMLSADEVHNSLFAGAASHAGRGKNLIAIRLREGTALQQPPNVFELIHQGSIRFDPSDVLFSGPNPF